MSKKQFVTVLFNYRGTRPLYSLYCRFSQGTLSHTFLKGTSTFRPWMKKKRLKLKSTVSRVLLINVSESGPISELKKKNSFDFDTNFTGVFFHDSIYFLTFYPSWKIKIILFEIFPSSKNFNLEVHNFFGNLFFFFKFSTFYPTFKEK